MDADFSRSTTTGNAMSSQTFFIYLDALQLQKYVGTRIRYVPPHLQQSTTRPEPRRRTRKTVCCVNCGEGHFVKDCPNPITSFGIIAFKSVANKEEERDDLNRELQEIVSNHVSEQPVYPKIKFLMIQRKDTMGYIDFIRGKYPEHDEDKKRTLLTTFVNEMTADEKQQLLALDFDTLWNLLWVNHDSKTYKNEYAQAKTKFQKLDIPTLVMGSKTEYAFQEFSFPKGRKNMKETNVACAEREFFEETGYNKTQYKFIREYPCIQEDFVGTNGERYRHIYYLVKMKDSVPPPQIDYTNYVQTGEVRNIGWFTFAECMQLIRPYDTAKKQVIQQVYSDIVAMNEKYSCTHYYHAHQS